MSVHGRTTPAIALTAALLLGGPAACGNADSTPGISADASDGGDAAPEVITCSPACQSPLICVDGACAEPVAEGCDPGTSGDCVDVYTPRVCNDAGTAWLHETCAEDLVCADGECGLPVICEPGKWICEGFGAKKQCNLNGTAFGAVQQCPEGEYCQSGKCGSACNIDPKFGSYVGCDFWSVDLPNYPDPALNPTPEDLPHAVVVSNPNELDAKVTFDAPEGYPLNLVDQVVGGLQSRVFMMPTMNVDVTGVTKKGIHMSATRPVLVHQFNPWDNQYSNDASLLLPETFLGSQYVVASWPSGVFVEFPGMPAFESQSGYFTVLAPFDGTKVTVTVTAPVPGGPRVNPMQPGETQTIAINKGEVLNIVCEIDDVFGPGDLTGSIVTANKPIAVFGGHEEAVIHNGCCADHLEEQMLPRDALGSTYPAVKSATRGGEPDYWRIIAVDAGVTVQTVPPQAGADGITLANKGDWVEVVTPESFEIIGDGKLQVAQYLVSQESTADFTGDPSMMLAVASELYRSFYVFMVPPDYTRNYATIIKQPASVVSVDGTAIDEAEFQTFGSGVWEFAWVLIEPGVHNASSDTPFGLDTYGYNNAASYGYTGGMKAIDD